MGLSTENVKKLIAKIGFAPQSGKSGVYFKSYAFHNGYTIFVDLNNAGIVYDSSENPMKSAIKVWERTTSNFSQAENLVVLECVDSLLEKGYSPSCIELEKTYPSGHGRSGRLDIFVKSVDGVPFLMIECKTWGTEFEKERAKMLKNGGQLFTYYANDRSAQFLCLYASRVDRTRDRQVAIVDVDSAWVSLSGVKEMFDHWNKNFKDNGIFEDYAAPYDVKHKALTYGKLETLQEEHSGKIYNQIMEILRHNAISDKPNAFNKLLNLFVCKIIDEADKNPEDELDFQWLETDTDETLQLRLNDLYKRGMWRFLEIEVIDYEQQEVVEKLANIDDDLTKQWIMKMYTDTRLKKSPNFAFVEVQDNRTFELNAKVVHEIVELLQVYKFRYEQKHEFLGNFFELLLNTSMKQEAGQFFTPVPITRFIILSLPLEKLVQNRVTERCDEPIPTVIDYACGSGHFLTEYMAQMQKIIDSEIDISHTSPRIKKLFQSWQGLTKFIWAKDSVYGIDLDNRLVKTTKVSAFFNGDGEANVVWANGLDSFTRSKAFRGKLVGAQNQDNGKFDILISNPPYSVDAFKSTIEFGEESFELYSSLTDNSSEIECLFIERMKQLLKIGGWAAVILPSSILTNGGIHAKARAILLKYFNIKAIVEAGANTFMKTNTSTVILFLERRSNDDHLNISRAINRFFTSFENVAASGIENAFSTFVLNAYEGITFEDYVSLFKGETTENAKAHELYEDYRKTFGEDFRARAIKVEKEKLLYFLLTYPQTTVLVKTGKGKEEKKFLGYEFSERRGHEGLHRLPGGTKLYDEANPLNPQKASSYVYHALLDEQCEIDDSIKNNVSYGRMSSFIEYGTILFERKINLGKKINKAIRYAFPTARLSEIANIEYGVRIVKSDATGDEFPVYGGGGETFRTSEWNREDRYVISRFGMSPDCVRFVKGKFFLNDSGMTVSPKDETLLSGKYLNLFLLFRQSFIYAMGRGASQKNIDMNAFKNFRLPLPPLDVQQDIVDALSRIEREESELQNGILLEEGAIEQIVALDAKAQPKAKLGGIATMIKRGKSAKYGNSHTQIIKSGQARGYYQFDFAERHFTDSSFVPDERNLVKGDVLINSTGVGTAGRVTLFNLDGDYVVDSHITIVRLDPEKALPKYILYALAGIGFKRIESMADGQSGQIELAVDTIRNIEIPLPPLERQKETADKIAQHEETISKLRRRIDELNVEKASILTPIL